MTRPLLHHVYLYGYSARPLPRWFRRAIARSEIHRAWLIGFMGFFVDGGVKYGPANPYRAAQVAPLPH